MQNHPSSVVAELILSAPAWVRIGITVRDGRLRRRAATELAETILGRLGGQDGHDSPDQLRLPL